MNSLLNLLIRFVLPVFVRVTVYFSLAYFAEVIIAALLELPFARGEQLFFIMNIVVFEIIYFFTKKSYRPKFLEAGSAQILANQVTDSELLVLDKESYSHRCSQEIYLKSIFLFYFFQLFVSFFVSLVFITKINVSSLLFGIFGLPASVLMYIGFVLMVAKYESSGGSNQGSIAIRGMGLGMQLFWWMYLYAGITHFGLSLGSLINLLV